jgi:putative lipoic acid-binding regulatory protein
VTRAGEQELLQFPCDYVFKVFAEHACGERFRDELLAAISRTIPVGLDALKQRDSSGGKYLCLSVVARVHNRQQVEEIYAAIRTIEGLCYLL